MLAAGDQRFESAVGDFGRSKLVIMVDKTRVLLDLGLFKDRGLLAPRISGESGNGSFGLASGISRDTTSSILQLIQTQLLVFCVLVDSHLARDVGSGIAVASAGGLTTSLSVIRQKDHSCPQNDSSSFCLVRI